MDWSSKTRSGTLVAVTRQGPHGRQWRYRLRYTPDPLMAPEYAWYCWAYSAEHALERWHESDAGEGYDLVGAPERVYVLP